VAPYADCLEGEEVVVDVDSEDERAQKEQRIIAAGKSTKSNANPTHVTNDCVLDAPLV